jgi:hypothetical protein
MPSLQKLHLTLQHDTLDRPQIGSGKPVGRRQRNRFQPELRDFPLLLGVEMRRLGALVAVEKEAERADSTERGHGQILSNCHCGRGFGVTHTVGDDIRLTAAA